MLMLRARVYIAIVLQLGTGIELGVKLGIEYGLE
jgi:hypothetical protein